MTPQRIWRELLDPRTRAQPPSLGALSQMLLAQPGIGPTLSEMFLVSIHLWRPAMRLLARGCPVGDGARAAFVYLHGKRAAAECGSFCLV